MILWQQDYFPDAENKYRKHWPYMEGRPALKLPKLGIWAFAAGALHKHTHDDATKGGEERSEDDSASKMRHAQRP